MAAKRVTRVMKVMAMGGEASPAKLGQKLGPYGIGPKFCQDFNAKTADRRGELVPCILTIYEDRTFDIVLKTSPTTFLLKKAAGIEKGSTGKGQGIVGHVTRAKIEEIAKYKMPDTTSDSLEAVIRSVEGTAKSMGIQID